ncbi:phosphatase PAP2 family protein [Arthrobacter sp. B3I4]|uniref:phosphatase PAP2 family protein n=1 Tax=Arthrobacter sp. B3I4 TaxID=3042267 RepID=UPI0027874ED1|nr:phosphatase PAP2 family protein [Arthrobacter sp. B3I4]MDQ0754328.1 membrane-associated phospholipid phosphatase [Arthrobacter sp. B3I4]
MPILERQRSGGSLRRPSQRAVFFAAAFLLVAGEALFWLMLAAVQTNSGLALLDGGVHGALVEDRSSLATAVLAAVSTVTSPTWLTVIGVLLALGWALRKREIWRPALLLGAMVATFGISTLIKHEVARARPSAADFLMGPDDALSFPSGHTFGAGVFLLALVYLLLCSARPGSAARPVRRATAVLAFSGAVLGTLLVAFSRIYLGYHWLTDVVASLGLAVAVVGIVVLVDGLRTARQALESHPERLGENHRGG